jgi:hypothetical protein
VMTQSVSNGSAARANSDETYPKGGAAGDYVGKTIVAGR